MSAFGKLQKMVNIAPIVNIDSPVSNEIGRYPILMGEGLTSSRFGPTMCWRSTVASDVIVLYWAGILLELQLREGMLIRSRDSWHVAMQLVMQLVAQCLGDFRQLWQTHLPLPHLPS